jgi:hypothetical protein
MKHKWVRRQLQFEHSGEGLFWMDWDSFVGAFSRVEVCSKAISRRGSTRSASDRGIKDFLHRAMRKLKVAETLSSAEVGDMSLRADSTPKPQPLGSQSPGAGSQGDGSQKYKDTEQLVCGLAKAGGEQSRIAAPIETDSMRATHAGAVMPVVAVVSGKRGGGCVVS